jgi:excisionase family DNA binding protein
MKDIQISINTEKLYNEIRGIIMDELKGIKKDHSLNQPDELLTREETSQLLKINLSTLWHWQKKGKLPTYSIGNRIYFKRGDIEKALIKVN